MADIIKFPKRISVNYCNGQFYLLGEKQLPPVYAWCEVQPIFESPGNDYDKLAKAIESAKLTSKTKEEITETDLNPKPFNKEQGKILDNAAKIWSINWEKIGNVYITSWEPFPKSETSTYRGKAWRPMKDTEVIFHAPASIEDVAKWLIDQKK